MRMDAATKRSLKVKINFLVLSTTAETMPAPINPVFYVNQYIK
jgi:hypothetical protein